MASSSFSSKLPSSDTADTPSRSLRQVPTRVRCQSLKGICALVPAFDLGDVAERDAKKPDEIAQAARRIVARVVPNSPNLSRYRWAKISKADQLRYTDELCREYPWLTKFETNWAAETILCQTVNNKINNLSHKRNRERKRAAELEQAASVEEPGKQFWGIGVLVSTKSNHQLPKSIRRITVRRRAIKPHVNHLRLLKRHLHHPFGLIRLLLCPNQHDAASSMISQRSCKLNTANPAIPPNLSFSSIVF
jgi:hypothetical protein